MRSFLAGPLLTAGGLATIALAAAIILVVETLVRSLRPKLRGLRSLYALLPGLAAEGVALVCCRTSPAVVGAATVVLGLAAITLGSCGIWYATRLRRQYYTDSAAGRAIAQRLEAVSPADAVLARTLITIAVPVLVTAVGCSIAATALAAYLAVLGRAPHLVHDGPPSRHGVAAAAQRDDR